MTTRVLFPSLNVEGWTNNSYMVASNMFSHFLMSDYSQTNLFRGLVSSMGYIAFKSSKSIDDFKRELEKTLITYYEKYFYNVRCVVDLFEDSLSITNFEVIDAQDVKLTIDLEFFDKENNKIVLGKLLTYDGLSVKSVVDYSNYGDIAGRYSTDS